ncbi:MAG: LCP family protein [Demequina sp.]|nr:LCP family protein [Demequina sp.]
MPPSVPPRRGAQPPSVQPAGRRTSEPGPVPQRRSVSSKPAPERPRAGAAARPPLEDRQPLPQSTAPAPVPKRHRLRNTLVTLTLVVAILVVGLWWWVDSRITHVDALTGASDTPGQTYLIVGSDSRDGWADDGTVGARTDTIMLVHRPVSGPPALISIPRDSYVEIPGHGGNKINAAFAFGGPQLLVQTVEGLTGLTIDRYVEVGFLGVMDIVDALGGVELCYDADVNDPYSTLVWQAGCHRADGATALAFSRMRYADPLGDIGRTVRQQQVVSAVADGVLSTSTFVNPKKLFRVASAGLDSFRVSSGTGVVDLARMARVVNAARGPDAVRGTPPLASLDHRIDGVGSTVLLDPEALSAFWVAIATGEYPPGTTVGGVT